MAIADSGLSAIRARRWQHVNANLFLAQRDRGIDSRGAHGGKKRGQSRKPESGECGRRKTRGIANSHAEKNA
jgi:hypothetical protein